MTLLSLLLTCFTSSLSSFPLSVFSLTTVIKQPFPADGQVWLHLSCSLKHDTRSGASEKEIQVFFSPGVT